MQRSRNLTYARLILVLTMGYTSPAINQGVTIATVTNDYAGAARPQGTAFDIGAYEFGGQPVGSLPSPKNLRVMK
jgi:hypothetical protein